MTSGFTFNKEEYNLIINEICNLVNSAGKDDLKALFTCIDNTTLNGSDTVQSVTDFCKLTESLQLSNLCPASVCLYPCFVKTAKDILSSSLIRVASVAGGFPAGQIPTHLKLNEVRYVIDNGADEVDFVINRGAILSGDNSLVFDEIAAAKQICSNNAILKVILETGELQSPELIYSASMIAMNAGADFVKTSTGKIPIGASPEAAFAILSAIADFSKNNHVTIGYKAAGGLSNVNDALIHYFMTLKLLNIKKIDKHIFRIGTSRLTNQLFKLLTID